MTGWNPRDPMIKKEIIEVVNEFWYSGLYNKTITTNRAFDQMAKKIISLREQDKRSEIQIKFLLNLLKNLSKYPLEIRNKAVSGNEKETYEAFTEYVNLVINTANKRLDILNECAEPTEPR